MPEKREPVYIYGAGGHGKVLHEMVRIGSKFDVAGFIDDAGPKSYLGLPVLTPQRFLKSVSPRAARLIIAIGDNTSRCSIATELKKKGFRFARISHPAAVLAQDVTLGEGSQVAAGAVINPGVRIGRHGIINTGATVDHDCRIGDFTHVAPGVTLGGGVRIGRNCWIGMGACIREYRMIGNNVVVGMGAVVVENVPNGVTVMGVPARIR